MRKLRLVVPPVTTVLLVSVVAGTSAAAGAVYAAARPVPALNVVCVPTAGARLLSAPIRGVCPRGTVLHRLPPGARGLTGAPGSVGPAGPTGATGARGATGTNGTNGTNGATNVQVMESTLTISPNTNGLFFLGCPGGSVATGGGFRDVRAGSGRVVTSAPLFGAADRKPTGWELRVHNAAPTPMRSTAYVMCASP